MVKSGRQTKTHPEARLRPAAVWKDPFENNQFCHERGTRFNYWTDNHEHARRSLVLSQQEDHNV